MAKFAKKFNVPVMPVNARRFWRGLKITAQGVASTVALAGGCRWMWSIHAASGWVAVGEFILAVLSLAVALANIYITGAGKRVNRGEGA